MAPIALIAPIALVLALALTAVGARAAPIEAALGIYATMQLSPAADATIALLDLDGRALGPRLDAPQFCDLAARGAAVIADATYQVAGSARESQVFCGRLYTRLQRKQPVAAGALGRSRFERVDWRYGLGAERYKLVPWRTLAAPAGLASIGQALAVPALQGLVLPDGTIHDGEVFVADRLEPGAEPRVELFIGLEAQRSAAERALGAIGAIVGVQRLSAAPAAAARLRALHSR